MIRTIAVIVGFAVAAYLGSAMPDALAQAKAGGAAASDKSDMSKEERALRKALKDLGQVEQDLQKVSAAAKLENHPEKALRLVQEARTELSRALQLAGGREQMKDKALDINSAGVAELTALPGIDNDTAQKIRSGAPYARKDDLVKRKVVTQAQYDKIKDMIVATPAKR